MTRHRVPVLAGLHLFPDPEHSPDPRVRELVGALRTLPVAPEPSAHFRAELRAQLVAVAPRLVAEGPADLIRHTPATLQAAQAYRTAPAPRRSLRSRLPRLRLGRPLRLVTATMTVLVMLLGMTVWMSRSALPGDALYGIKRASENAQLSLTSGGPARAKELLSLAKTRADEVSALLGKPSAMALGAGNTAGAGVNEQTAQLIEDTLGSADDNVREASRLLGDAAVRGRSAEPLDVMTGWAPDQLGRLQSIDAHLPNGSLRDRLSSSADLVSAALTRADNLRPQLGCDCLDRPASDELGPLPCTTCAAPASNPTVPGQKTPAPQQSTGGTTKTDEGGTSSGDSGTSNTGSASPQQSPEGSPSLPVPTGSVPSLPGLPLPGLPLPAPTASTTSPPLSVNSCGLTVALGPLGLGLGTCGLTVDLN